MFLLDIALFGFGGADGSFVVTARNVNGSGSGNAGMKRIQVGQRQDRNTSRVGGLAHADYCRGLSGASSPADRDFESDL
jgi:hypothetical protein